VDCGGFFNPKLEERPRAHRGTAIMTILPRRQTAYSRALPATPEPAAAGPEDLRPRGEMQTATIESWRHGPASPLLDAPTEEKATADGETRAAMSHDVAGCYS